MKKHITFKTTSDKMADEVQWQKHKYRETLYSNLSS